MKQKFIDECKTIQQNCTYTAETHHQMAISAKMKAIWLEIIPAICAALTGTLVAVGWAPNRLLLITIVSSVVSAVAAVLNPNKSYQEHLSAGKNFTALKHDARFLHEATIHKISEDGFTVEVENLHRRYNELIKTVPPTSPKAFEKARKIVQAGIHVPDKDAKGKIK